MAAAARPASVSEFCEVEKTGRVDKHWVQWSN